MRIIISPSKTMQFQDISSSGIHPQYLDKTNKLIKEIRSLSKSEMGKKFKIKDKLLDEVYSKYQNFDTLDQNIAIKAYTGMVFKGLKLSEYGADEWDYLNEHVIILSALYGFLTPNTLIKPYRLDFSCMKGLYDFWNDVNNNLNNQIINLASNEFSKMVNKKMISIGFREYKDGKYKNVATYSKQARGTMLNYMIINNITKVNDIKRFSDNGYSFNKELSDDFNLIFSR